MRGYILPIALFVAGVTISSCAALKPAAPPPVLTPPCAVHAPSYTLDQEKQLARETLALTPNSMLFQAMVDYGRMRKAARASCTLR